MLFRRNRQPILGPHPTHRLGRLLLAQDLFFLHPYHRLVVQRDSQFVQHPTGQLGLDLTDRLDAGQIVNHVAQQVGGKGGGRKDLARAGGDQVDELDGALESVVGFVEKALV